MNARQLTRTGIVLLGVYFLASGVAGYCGSLGLALTVPGGGVPAASEILVQAAPLFLIGIVSGILLIALSHWASRRLEPNETQPADANHALYVGLYLLGVYFTTVAASELISSGLLLADKGGLFSGNTPFGRLVRIQVVTAGLKAALGVTVCVVASKLASRLDGGEDRRPWLLTGTQLLGAYFVVLGLIGLMGYGAERLRLPTNLLPDMPLRGQIDVRLIESVAQCVLGALLFLRPLQVLRVKIAPMTS
jgi:hypothetical protein